MVLNTTVVRTLLVAFTDAKPAGIFTNKARTVSPVDVAQASIGYECERTAASA